jgi:hypothetical protein
MVDLREADIDAQSVDAIKLRFNWSPMIGPTGPALQGTGWSWLEKPNLDEMPITRMKSSGARASTLCEP